VLPLLVAPRQLCLPAGQERGRTIPVTSFAARQRHVWNQGQSGRENDIDDAILPRLTAEDNKTRFSGNDLGPKPNVLLFDLAQCASIKLILTTQ
jgi:hypothetical protein